MNALTSAIRKQILPSDRVVFVSGNFNLVHPGHLRLLRLAAECGDFLVVGLNPGDAGEQLLPVKDRLDGIRAISLVDFAFIMDRPVAEVVGQLKPQIVVKGREHENCWNPEADVLAEYGGKMVFGSGDMSVSLTSLLLGERQGEGFIENGDFIRRHGLDTGGLEALLKGFSQLKVVVAGETIVDEYITCDALGMSREDPTIVVTPVGKSLYLGGAGIVSAHAAGLGAQVRFFSVLGDDDMSEFVRDRLGQSGVGGHLFTDQSRPTILKQRFRSAGKTLLRVNHFRGHPIGRDLQERMVDELIEILPEQDILIFSDFNYGVLPQPLVERLVAACESCGVMMVADSQSSSQVGDVSRFMGMDLMTPTEREARLALKDFESGLVVLAEKLRKKSRAKNLFITLDKEGLLIHADAPNDQGFITDRLDAVNPLAVDPAGAGDSLLTCSALALAAGADIWQGAYLGSLAAGCQVGRQGNTPLTRDTLLALPMFIRS